MFKNYVLDPNSDVENEIFVTDFSWQIWAKNTKTNPSLESVKTKEHKESNSCEKYYFLIDAFYKINFWPILKKLPQKIDFRHFPLFEIIAQFGSILDYTASWPFFRKNDSLKKVLWGATVDS